LGPGSHEKNERLFQRLSDDATLGPLVREIHGRDWFASGLMLSNSTIREATNWLQSDFLRNDTSRSDDSWKQFHRLNNLISKLSLRMFGWAYNVTSPVLMKEIADTKF